MGIDEIAWKSDIVRMIVEPVLTSEEVRAKGYHNLPFETFATLRLHEHGEELMEKVGGHRVYQKDLSRIPIARITYRDDGNEFPTNYTEPIRAKGGRISKEVIVGQMEVGSIQSHVPIGIEHLLDVLGVEVIPVRIKRNGPVIKRNHDQRMSQIEYKVIKDFAAHPECGFIDAYWVDGDAIGIERAEGPSLAEETYFDMFGTRKYEFMMRYRKVIDEFLATALRLNADDSPLDTSDRSYLLQDKFQSIAEKAHVSVDEARSNYHTCRLAYGLGIDVQAFKEIFAPIQRIMNDYASRHSFWINDHAPKNKMGKSFDANKIDFAPLQTGLTLIVDWVPAYFTREEREELMMYAVERWKAQSKQKGEFDDDFMVAYDCEAVYRAVWNAICSVSDADRIWQGDEKGYLDGKYFEYARFANDARLYIDIAHECLLDLVSRGVLPQEQARKVSAAVVGAINKEADFTNPRDVMIDLGAYTVIEADKYRKHSNPTALATAQANTAPSHS